MQSFTHSMVIEPHIGFSAYAVQGGRGGGGKAHEQVTAGVRPRLDEICRVKYIYLIQDIYTTQLVGIAAVCCWWVDSRPVALTVR